MSKKIVIALGGNALGNNLVEQRQAIKSTVKAIADLIEEGHQVVVTHGNGPQVGLIDVAMGRLNTKELDQFATPLSVCSAMSQAYIGFDIQNLLREELLNRGIERPVTDLITQVCVSGTDPALQNPSKPIGQFMTMEQAEAMRKEGYIVEEDSGRGYRRIVASPKPIDIVEKESIKSLIHQNHVVICCGGGGIPVVPDGNHLEGIDAVIDKDLASAKLAELVDADCLIILTAVERVAINFGKPNEQWLEKLTVDQAKQYIEEGHFAAGSMLPKIQAAIEFVSSKAGHCALITMLEKAREGLDGKTGTLVAL